MIDATKHGAKGDGAKDDTDAIREALAEAGDGGTVFLPLGTYRVKGALNVAKRRLVGELIGDDCTRIQAGAPLRTVLLAHQYPCAIDHVMVIASGKDERGQPWHCESGLWLWKATHSELRHVRVAGGQVGARLEFCAHLSADVLRTGGCESVGILLGGGNGARLTAVQAIHNEGDGIVLVGHRSKVYDAGRVHVDGFVTEKNGLRGLVIRDAGSGSWSNGIVEGNGSGGVCVEHSHNVELQKIHALGPGRLFDVCGGTKDDKPVPSQMITFDRVTAPRGAAITTDQLDSVIVRDCYESSHQRARPLPVTLI